MKNRLVVFQKLSLVKILPLLVARWLCNAAAKGHHSAAEVFSNAELKTLYNQETVSSAFAAARRIFVHRRVEH